jgi:hypothetical protein
MKDQTLLAGALVCLVTGALALAQPTEGLVAYYPFRGNANDLGPNHLHGTVHGATLAPDRAANPNMAYSFNGSTSYLDLGSSVLLRPTNEVTLSLWATADWANLSAPAALAGNTQKGGYELHLNPSAGFIQAVVSRSVYGSSASQRLTNLTSGWHHFAFASDSKATYWYIDGKLISAIGGSGVIKYAYANNFLIGAEAGDGALPEGNYYNGTIDEVRIYNRALSQSEIRFLSELPDVPPDIDIEHAVLLSWETVPGNYRVESAPAADGPWTVVPGTVAWGAARSQLAVPARSAQPYYRLVRLEGKGVSPDY